MSAPYTGFGPVPLYHQFFTDGVVAAEIGPGGESLSPEDAAARLYELMRRHSRPTGLLAGDTYANWQHASAFASSFLELTDGLQMKFGPRREWIGLVVEVRPGLDVFDLEQALGDRAGRLGISVLGRTITPQLIRYVRRLARSELVPIVLLYDGEVDKSQVAMFHRKIERYEPGTGRGIIVTPSRRPLFS